MTEIPEKVYSDDPNVPYRSTELSAPQSKMKIEGILAQYGIKDTGWRWDLEGNEVFVGFTLEENVNGQLLKTFVRVDAPLIWKRARSGGHGAKVAEEEVDWRISLRIMFWFIKSTLEVSYMWKVRKAAAFLPFLRTAGDRPLANVILSRFSEIQSMLALEVKPGEKLPPRRVNE